MALGIDHRSVPEDDSRQLAEEAAKNIIQATERMEQSELPHSRREDVREVERHGRDRRRSPRRDRLYSSSSSDDGERTRRDGRRREDRSVSPRGRQRRVSRSRSGDRRRGSSRR